jgi:hypothetical protein
VQDNAGKVRLTKWTTMGLVILIVPTLLVVSPAKADSYNIEQLGAPDFSGDFTQSFGASGDSFTDLESYISGKDTYRGMIQPSGLGSSWALEPKGYTYNWEPSPANLGHTPSFSTNSLFLMNSCITCDGTIGLRAWWDCQGGPASTRRPVWEPPWFLWAPKPRRGSDPPIPVPEPPWFPWAPKHQRGGDPPVSVPEPPAITLLGTGLVAIAGLAGRKLRKRFLKAEPKAREVSPTDCLGQG